MRKMEADVIVVGGGLSGLIAATAAAEKGVSVIVFEKGRTVGGAANMGMGFFAVESKYQKNQMYNYTVDDAYNDFMTYNHWMADGELVRRIYQQSADTVDWLESMGVEFLGAFNYFYGSNMTWHVVKTPGSNKPAERSASIMVKAVKSHADELGVEFHFGVTVKEIITGEKGQAIGVRAIDSNGETIEAESYAVIVGTGGFGNNTDMIKEHFGLEWGKDIFTFRIPGIDGEGMKMAWASGAGRTAVTMEVTYNSPGVSNLYNTIAETMRQPNLMVTWMENALSMKQL